MIKCVECECLYVKACVCVSVSHEQQYESVYVSLFVCQSVYAWVCLLMCMHVCVYANMCVLAWCLFCWWCRASWYSHRAQAGFCSCLDAQGSPCIRARECTYMPLIRKKASCISVPSFFELSRQINKENALFEYNWWDMAYQPFKSRILICILKYYFSWTIVCLKDHAVWACQADQLDFLGEWQQLSLLPEAPGLG